MAFTWVVWHELQTQRKERTTTDATNRKLLGEIKETLAGMAQMLNSMMTSSQRRRSREDTLKQNPFTSNRPPSEESGEN